jgi:hypothetical protein
LFCSRLFLDCFVVPPRNDDSSPVIANEVKQSRRRPRSPDGHQATACAWIASYLAGDGHKYEKRAFEMQSFIFFGKRSVSLRSTVKIIGKYGSRGNYSQTEQKGYTREGYPMGDGRFAYRLSFLSAGRTL